MNEQVGNDILAIVGIVILSGAFLTLGLTIGQLIKRLYQEDEQEMREHPNFKKK